MRESPMEELVMKGPNRFGREKEVKVLLKKQKCWGQLRKGWRADRQTGKSGEKTWSLKYICGMARKGV